MLLTKKEKLYNVAFLVALLTSVLSFYSYILNGDKFITASIATFSLLLGISTLHNNFYNKRLKLLTFIGMFLILAWLVNNKIYFIFFNDYVNFARVSTASSPSLIVETLKSLLTNVNLIILVISSLLTLGLLNKCTIRFKYSNLISTGLFALFTAVVIIANISRFEIVSYLFTGSYDFSQILPKPIEEKKENMFDEIMNRTEKTNEYTGIAKGKNLIMIQLESYQNIMLNREYNGYEITPFLNELTKNKSLYFDNCFAQVGWGNTSDSEFIVNNSMYPLVMESIYVRCPENEFYGLPKILRDNGYSANSYHGYIKSMWNRETFHPIEGFEHFYHSEDYPTGNSIGFGIADEDFFKQSIPYMKSKTTPAYHFLITLSSHTPYNLVPNMSDIKLLPEHEETLFGKYVINMSYVDRSLKVFFDELKKNDLYDNSIIVLYGDHQGLNISVDENKKNVSEFLGTPYNYDTMLNIPLIVHIPGMDDSKTKTISTTCGQMDVMPTVLNLLGIEYDAVYFGDDIMSLSEDSKRVIGGTAYMPYGSFINKDMVFEMSQDSIYENSKIYERNTGKIKNVANREEVYEMSRQLEKDVKLSGIVVDRNLIMPLLNKNNIVLHDVNPQPFIFNINADTSNSNYKARVDEAVNAGFNIVSVDVHNYNNEFYVNPPLEIENEMTLVEFLTYVKDTYPNTYVILSNIDEFLKEVFIKVGKENPELATIAIPEIYDFKDYEWIKVFNMNNPVLSLKTITNSAEDISNFITSNDLFAVKLEKESANYDLIMRLDKQKNIFVYTNDVNDAGELKYYRSHGIDGFYTHNIEFASLLKNRFAREK